MLQRQRMTSVLTPNGPMESTSVKQFAVAALKRHHFLSDSSAHGHTCADHGKSDLSLIEERHREGERQRERADHLTTTIILHHKVRVCII